MFRKAKLSLSSQDNGGLRNARDVALVMSVAASLSEERESMSKEERKGKIDLDPRQAQGRARRIDRDPKGKPEEKTGGGFLWVGVHQLGPEGLGIPRDARGSQEDCFRLF